jgi:hypothetical protein
VTQDDPFARLGLEHGADEAQVKKAYARELKSTRPEGDPIAFQRLRQAYEAALAIARNRQPSPAAIVDAGGRWPDPKVTVAFHKAVPEVAAPSFDFNAFLADATSRLGQDDPQDLQRWLEESPELYSIERKAAVGQALYQHLSQHAEDALCTRAARVLTAFFDLDFLHIVAVAEAAGRRAKMIVAIERGDVLPLGEEGYDMRVALRQLRRRFHPWQAWLATARPNTPQQVAGLAMRLKAHFGGALPPGINPRQVEFFQRLTEPGYFGRWHWAALAARSLGILVIGAPVAALAFMLLSEDRKAAFAFGIGIMAICALPIAVLWLRSLSRWLHVIENRRSGCASQIAGWTPIIFSALIAALSWPGWLPVPAAIGLVLPCMLHLVDNRWSMIELGISALGFMLVLGGFFPENPAVFAAGFCLAVIGRRAIDLSIARRRNRMLFTVAGNAWSRALAIAVLVIGLVIPVAR